MYCEQDWNTGKWRFFPGGEERLATKISGMYVARDRYQAGVEIPKQTVQIYELDFDKELYPKQWEAYQILSKKSALIMDDMLAGEDAGDDGKVAVSVAAMIALITRQRQMMTWPKGIKMFHPKTKALLFECEVAESVKLDRIIDRSGEGLIPEFVNDEQERVVVFSQFKQPLIELERRIKDAGISVVRYDGDTSRELANEIQIDFDRKYQSADKPYKWDVVLANYKKGGVGLNLNAATQMIILDEEWNPGKEDQAYGRIDRLGQSEETGVHVLRVKSTVDMWMASLIEQKRQMIAGFETHTDLQQELMDILRGLK
jgi:SNF2 family DNA or RNA helicase